MANACIAYTNLADAAALTSSSNVSLLPVSNIQNVHVARKWRATDGTTASFIADFGSLKSFDTLAVMGITGTQIQFRISSTDPTGLTALVYDSGVLSVAQAYLSAIAIISSPVSGRYIRVDITTTGTYVEAGRFFAGVRSQFAYNFVRGWQRSYTDRSLKTKTRGGQTQIFQDVTYRSLDVTFDFLTQSDRNGFVEDIDRVNATKVDVLFITDPSSTNLARDSLWGLISNLTPVVQPYYSTFTKQYQIEERL